MLKRLYTHCTCTVTYAYLFAYCCRGFSVQMLATTTATNLMISKRIKNLNCKKNAIATVTQFIFILSFTGSSHAHQLHHSPSFLFHISSSVLYILALMMKRRLNSTTIIKQNETNRPLVQRDFERCLMQAIPLQAIFF